MQADPARPAERVCARSGCAVPLLTWMDPEYCSKRCRMLARQLGAIELAAPAWDARRAHAEQQAHAQPAEPAPVAAAEPPRPPGFLARAIAGMLR